MSDRGNGLTCFKRGWARSPLGVAAALGVAMGIPPAEAHRTDEYLQATLIDIEPGFVRLDISLTPGVETFATFGPLLDSNHDGELSREEAAAYAEQVRSDLQLRIDGQPIKLQLQGHQFPILPELRDGTGSIHLELKAPLEEAGYPNQQLSFENHHLPAISVYLVNAVVPDSPEIQIGQQLRSTNQSECRISYRRTSRRIQRRPPFEWTGPVTLASIVAILVGCVLWRRARLETGR